MKLLAIETSTTKASVALSVDGVVSETIIDGVREHAKVLLPAINQLLLDKGFSIKALDGIVFGQGPGSFTGLRVACACAKGLAMAYDIPLYPVQTLAAIAYVISSQSEHEAVLAVIDARMQEWYWAYYHVGEQIQGAFVQHPSEIKLLGEASVILAGVGFAEGEPFLTNGLQEKIKKRAEIYPLASTMIAMVEQGHIQSIRAIDAEPIYIRNQITQGGTHG